MSRVVTLLFAMLAYAVFFATFLYLVVFVGDFSFASRTVDVGPAADPITAAVVDIALIALFGLQHSVMARQAFKRRWLRIVPPPVERSFYVLAASAVLLLLFVLWRPIGMVVWSIPPTAAPFRDIVWALFWVGWLTVLVSTFLTNHFELFGLQHAWFNLRGREAEPPRLRRPLFYKWVRHPLYVGFLLAFWAAPEMTIGHLLLAAGFTIYILIAIRYEERDLVSLLPKGLRALSRASRDASPAVPPPHRRLTVKNPG